MCLANEGIDLMLMVNDVRFQVVKVEDLCTLGLRQDKVQQEDETKPGVERYPTNYEDCP